MTLWLRATSTFHLRLARLSKPRPLLARDFVAQSHKGGFA